MAAKKKKAPAKAKKSAGSSNLVPLYILIIMALATALVMVLNSRSGNIAVKDSKDKPSVSADKAGSVKSDGQSPADAAKTADAGEKKKVKLYYLVYSDRTGKISPGSVIREVTGADPLAAALGELVKGLSDAEEKRGLISAMPEGLKVRSVTVRNGIAEIDMSSEFAQNAQGDFITGRLNQLFYTATQFPGVKGIIVRMNGKPFSTIGGDGLLLSWPMKKAL